MNEEKKGGTSMFAIDVTALSELSEVRSWSHAQRAGVVCYALETAQAPGLFTLDLEV